MLLPRKIKIDYRPPLPDQAFFSKNGLHELSAPRLVYSCLLNPGIERIADTAARQISRRGAEELRRIETAKDTETLIVPMILQELNQPQTGKNRKAYAISLLCVLLGFYDNEESEKLLWDYYHYMKLKYPNDTYSDGPLLGLIEIRERRREKTMPSL
jgi:hypothetical protein